MALPIAYVQESRSVDDHQLQIRTHKPGRRTSEAGTMIANTILVRHRTTNSPLTEPSNPCTVLSVAACSFPPLLLTTTAAHQSDQGDRLIRQMTRFEGIFLCNGRSSASIMRNK